MIGLFNLKLGKLQVPLYDIGTLTAGFYVGYNEGQGIYVSSSVEYLTKYGPTAFAVATNPITIKLTNTFGKWMNRKVAQNLQRGNLEVTLSDGSKEKYGNLDESQREEITPKIFDRINTLESKLHQPKYIKSTLSIGTRTAIKTVIGYIAGRLYSQIHYNFLPPSSLI